MADLVLSLLAALVLWEVVGALIDVVIEVVDG